MGLRRARLRDAETIAARFFIRAAHTECGIHALGSRLSGEVFSFCKLLQIYNSSIL